MKKLEIEKTKPTFIISVLKVDIIKVGLVFSISNFFITKTPLANNWRRKKIPSCSYSALLQILGFEYFVKSIVLSFLSKLEALLLNVKNVYHFHNVVIFRDQKLKFKMVLIKYKLRVNHI